MFNSHVTYKPELIVTDVLWYWVLLNGHVLDYRSRMTDHRSGRDLMQASILVYRVWWINWEKIVEVGCGFRYDGGMSGVELNGSDLYGFKRKFLGKKVNKAIKSELEVEDGVFADNNADLINKIK